MLNPISSLKKPRLLLPPYEYIRILVSCLDAPFMFKNLHVNTTQHGRHFGSHFCSRPSKFGTHHGGLNRRRGRPEGGRALPRIFTVPGQRRRRGEAQSQEAGHEMLCKKSCLKSDKFEYLTFSYVMHLSSWMASSTEASPTPAASSLTQESGLI